MQIEREMTDDAVSQDDNLRLADLRFKATRGDADAIAKLKKDLVARKALPFYTLVATDLVSFFPVHLLYISSSSMFENRH